MQNERFFFVILWTVYYLFTGLITYADQPIFNEMPRWDNGWGVQIVEEYRHESDLMSGNKIVADDFSEDVHILHIEAVYTWDKSIRVTAKLPYVLDAKREFPYETKKANKTNSKNIQKDKGIGDATLALPLKKYFNLDGRSGSWTLAPQVRIPLSGNGDYKVYDGIWGSGLSMGYETETYNYILATGISSWVFEKNEPVKISANIDLGFNYRIFSTSGHLKLETDFIYKDDGTEKLYIGPSIYLRISDILHTNIKLKKEIHSRRSSLDHGNGIVSKVGLGLVF